jgi:hypothetical protein
MVAIQAKEAFRWGAERHDRHFTLSRYCAERFDSIEDRSIEARMRAQ